MSDGNKNPTSNTKGRNLTTTTIKGKAMKYTTPFNIEAEIFSG